MKKLAIVALLVVAGCRSPSAGAGPARQGGANSPRDAIERFLGTAKTQDYEGMGLVFGSNRGPARGTIAKDELEKREFIFMRCLRHDRFQLGSETATPIGERVIGVQLWFKDLTASTDFTLVEGPNGRWYVRQFEMDNLKYLCAAL